MKGPSRSFHSGQHTSHHYLCICRGTLRATPRRSRHTFQSKRRISKNRRPFFREANAVHAVPTAAVLQLTHSHLTLSSLRLSCTWGRRQSRRPLSSISWSTKFSQAKIKPIPGSSKYAAQSRKAQDVCASPVEGVSAGAEAALMPYGVCSELHQLQRASLMPMKSWSWSEKKCCNDQSDQ